MYSYFTQQSGCQAGGWGGAEVGRWEVLQGKHHTTESLQNHTINRSFIQISQLTSLPGSEDDVMNYSSVWIVLQVYEGPVLKLLLGSRGQLHHTIRAGGRDGHV